MTHVVNAAVVALGNTCAGRGFPESQVSAVEQADDTGAEGPPTNDTHVELVSHAVVVPVSARSSPRLAEQSRKRSTGEIEQNRQATLRRRRESAASTAPYVQLRPPPPPPPPPPPHPLRRPRCAVVPPATVGPVDVYAVLDHCPEGRYSGSANSAKLYPQRKGMSAPLVAQLFSKGAWGTASTRTHMCAPSDENR